MTETEKARSILANFRWQAQRKAEPGERESFVMTDTQKSIDLLARLAWQPQHEQEVMEEAFRIVAERRHREFVAERAAARINNFGAQ